MSSLYKFALGLNAFFLVSYSIILIVAGTSLEGNARVGMLAGFGAAQGYAIMFFLFLIAAFFTPDLLYGTGKHDRERFFTLIGIMIVYLIAIVIVIIVGSQMDGYWRIALIVGGSVAIVHYFGFILAIIGLLGASAARE